MNVAEALQLVLSECKPNAKIVDLCEKGDSYIREYVSSLFKLCVCATVVDVIFELFIEIGKLGICTRM